MLIDNSIMKAFGAKLDWAAERLSSRNSNITLPANGTKNITPQCCSVVKQKSNTAIPVFVPNKYVVPPEHEAVIRVFNTSRPRLDMLALIELIITTVDTVENATQMIPSSF